MRKAFHQTLSIVAIFLLLSQSFLVSLPVFAQTTSNTQPALTITMTENGQPYVEGSVATSPVTVQVHSTSPDSASVQIELSKDLGTTWEAYDPAVPLVLEDAGDHNIWFRQAGQVNSEKRRIQIAPVAAFLSDGALTDSEEIRVTVNEVNTAPILAAIGNKTVNEGSHLTFTATATDSDSAILTYSLVGAPTGASINATTGVFTWTPTEVQGPSSYTFEVVVSDGTQSDSEEITVTVNEVNTAPILAAIGNKTVDEETLLTFTATATDADLPLNTLTYSLVGAPTGASINALTGVFTWTPTEAQGPGSYTFSVRVSDGMLTDEEQITVTVNEVNAAPVLAAIGNKTVNEETLLMFTVTATDADLPPNTLTYSLVGAPTGASINATTGVFTWTPTEAQGPSSYTFEVVVSDGTQSDSEEITVTVNEVNAAPIIGAIGNKTVNEGSHLTFTATATDADLPSNTLTYSLVGTTTGASINALTGVFTWTPTEAQGPGSYTFSVRVSDGMLTDEEQITVTVNEVNEAPILAAIGNKTVNEGSHLTFTATATDADLPSNTLTYSLVGTTTGASINALTGVFTWTPTEAQGPGSYTFSVRVSDGMLTDEEQITVTVNEVNEAPILAAIGNKTVNEGSHLTFTATATDADLPSNTLTYSLVGTTTGASINALTGVFTWTPTEAQGPGSYTFSVRVSDGMLTDEEQITVTVNEVNEAPILAAIGNKTVNEGSLLTFTATATDADLPSNTLTYSLVGAPTGASINATTGEFTWTPTEAQGPNSYTFRVVVSDGTLTDSKEIIVTVNEVNGASTPVEPAPTLVVPTPPASPSPIAPTPEESELPEQPEISEELTPTITFNDISTNWAKDMIEDIAARGIITGYPDSTFRPNEPIKREHVAVMFGRAFELTPKREAVSFSDVPTSHPYYEAIIRLQQAGIIDGSNGKFNPNEPLTRAQLAKILVIAFGLTPGGTSTFQDVPTTHWSYDYIAALADVGIALGDNGNFRPDKPVTRAQFVAFMYRALNL